MQKIFFNRKNESLPSAFQEKLTALINDGAEKIDKIPHKFDSNIVCVVKNGDDSEAVYFQNVKEFNQFRNALLRISNRDGVAWLKYKRS